MRLWRIFFFVFLPAREAVAVAPLVRLLAIRTGATLQQFRRHGTLCHVQFLCPCYFKGAILNALFPQPLPYACLRPLKNAAFFFGLCGTGSGPDGSGITGSGRNTSGGGITGSGIGSGGGAGPGAFTRVTTPRATLNILRKVLRKPLNVSLALLMVSQIPGSSRPFILASKSLVRISPPFSTM